MKEYENEQKAVPVDTGVIKDFLIIIQQFFDTLCNIVVNGITSKYQINNFKIGF